MPNHYLIFTLSSELLANKVVIKIFQNYQKFQIIRGPHPQVPVFRPETIRPGGAGRLHPGGTPGPGRKPSLPHIARRRPVRAMCSRWSRDCTRRPDARTSCREPRRASGPRRARSPRCRPEATPGPDGPSPDNSPGPRRRSGSWPPVWLCQLLRHPGEKVTFDTGAFSRLSSVSGASQACPIKYFENCSGSLSPTGNGLTFSVFPYFEHLRIAGFRPKKGCGGQGREKDSFHRFKRMVSRCKNRVFLATVPYPDYGSAYHYYGAASFSVG